MDFERSASAGDPASRPRPRKRWIFALLMLLLGSGFLYLVVLRPGWQMWQSRTWVPLPCHIVSSGVFHHPGRRGGTYRVEIRYTYRVGERAYQADRYEFMPGSSSGSAGKQAVVQQYPPGMERTVFVDPGNPSAAVLYRGPSADLWFGLIPLVMVALGGGLLWSEVRRGVLGERMPPVAIA